MIEDARKIIRTATLELLKTKDYKDIQMNPCGNCKSQFPGDVEMSK